MFKSFVFALLFIWSGWISALAQLLAKFLVEKGALVPVKFPRELYKVELFGTDLNCMCFCSAGPTQKLMDRSLIGGTAAVSFPGVVIMNGKLWTGCRSGSRIEKMLRHECAHIKQRALLGPLFLPCYCIASLIAVIRGKDWYKDNFFELSAKKAE